MTTAAFCRSGLVAGFRPEPEITVSDWADKYRVSMDGPEPGRWNTERVPYLRDIMNDLSPASDVEIVVLMKAAQGGATEGLLNALGCWMHRYPDSAMVVMPTVGAAKKFVRTRLDKFIAATPVLKEIVSPQRSRSGSNTTSYKQLVSGDGVVICGANSGVDLRSYPCRYALMDEVDGYPFDLDGEGDPTELVIQRTGAYRGRKVGLTSTPTLDDFSRIAKWYKRGDQRLFHLPCPLCGHMQPLIWYAGDDVPGGLRWPKGQPEKARYQCVSCTGLWEQWKKLDLLQHGEWIPTAPGVGRGKIRSYSINALYYPYGWPGNDWTNLASDWEAEHRDPIKRKSFINLKLGLPYHDPSEAKADADSLLGRCEPYGPEIPAGVAVLTVGVDVQQNRLELEVIGWGRDEESWSIDYRRLMGDTAKPEVWAELDDWLKSEFLSEAGIPLHIRATCIDARFQKEVVRKFCTERQSRKVWAVTGSEGNRPVWPSKVKRQRTMAAPVYTVGVDAAKEILYARLRIQVPGPGYCHFPSSSSHGRDYFEMLTAEVRIPDYSGPLPKFKWQKKQAGARNEALDCRDYGYAALMGLTLTSGFRLNYEAARMEKLAESQRSQPTQPVKPVSAARMAWTAKPSYAVDPYLP